MILLCIIYSREAGRNDFMVSISVGLYLGLFEEYQKYQKISI